MGVSKSRQRNGKQQDRCVLIDITNDSPIVGVANLETPLSSAAAKQRARQAKNTTTPASGDGEALLRGQVKTLLQKVEEEAELSKLSLESRPFLRLVKSPVALLAPTPVNTPQIPSLSGGSATAAPSPVVEEELISQVVKYMMCEEKSEEEEKNGITRSLLMDFSEKTETCESECCSELSYEVSSDWSVQVNASSHEDDEEEEDFENVEMVEELCKGMKKISVNDVKWEGKHTRFVYNSDDEIVEEEEEDDEERESDSVSPNVIRLKGLPTPKGKHLRFPEE